ncbi:MAG: glycosyltransferase [Acetobacter sp.]|nr:glycosyltransferase [Acetobacter sp.]
MPKISVLMPVYKTPEPFLREAVESILNQTAENFEFLILDDCPEDRAAEAVIASYDDARIKYFRNERNLGIAGSRNRLMEMATGDYLAVADHDDVSLPQRLEKEASYLDAHRECGVVSGWYQLLCRKRGRIRRRPEHNAEIGAALAEGCAVIHPACMLRRQELERLGVRYEEAYTPAEDYALFMRLRGRTGFYNLQEVLLLYRNFPENTSHRRRREMHAADERIKAEIREAERRRGQVMDEVRAVETELKALIRRGQREILARRRGQSAGYGSGTAGWAVFLAERYGRSVPPDKQCCWDIWDAEQAGAWDDGDEAEKNGEWSKIWKRMLNFRL